MIDLRSDTVTFPSREMLKAINRAKLGDDVFAEDPTTNELQEYIADLFGKQGALFVSSGVMGNQLAIKALTNPGDEVILESQSHIFYYETAAPAVISNIQMNCIDSDRGMMPLDKIEKAIRPADYYFPKSQLICIENTHNRHSGTIIDLDYLKALKKLAAKYKLKMHLDGARLWNAIVATDVKPKEWAGLFDTVSVCFSKGLGAPIGSILAADREIITKARKWRKIIGGGMRQTGILAAAAKHALDNNLRRLADDHANAKLFAEAIGQCNEFKIDLSRVQTNIVCFDVRNHKTLLTFSENCKREGLLMIPFGKTTIRAVFHMNISRQDTKKAIKIIKRAIMSSLND